MLRTRDPSGNISTETLYVGDELEVTHHTDENDQTSYEYAYNIFVLGEQVARISFVEQAPGTISDPQIEYLLNDRLGTPQAVADEDGNVLPRQAPTPYGRMGEVEGPGFTGHRHDNDLGVIDMRGRLYDPAVGRFMQADPTIAAPFFSEGLNPYSYVFNNPTNWVDPSGLCPTPDGQPAECEEEVTWEIVDPGQELSQQNSSAEATRVAYEMTMQQNMDQYRGGPQGRDQWGPGNYPGDIAPSQGNQFCGPECMNVPYAGITADNRITPNATLHEFTPRPRTSPACASSNWNVTESTATSNSSAPFWRSLASA